MLINPVLHCPLRGTLKANAKAKDGLTFTEEKRRIGCIKHLLDAGYPKDRIKTETIILRVGHKGKNALRADVVVYDVAPHELAGISDEDRRGHMLLIAEIKRDHADSASGKEEQLKPALSFLPRHDALGIYWDDVEQTLFFKKINGGKTLIKEASLTNLPPYGSGFKVRPIYYTNLERNPDLVGVFSRFDALFDAYLRDEAVRGFIAEHNPAAPREIADRIWEAADRGLWWPSANDAHERPAEVVPWG